MRTLKKNCQTLYYANQDSVIPIIEEYIDDNGNTYPLDTGETKIGYGKPIKFKGNIAMSGGESEAVEFGLDLSQYSAVLILPKGSIPITETSLIWHENEPTMANENEVDKDSADYTVVKISPSLNVDKFILQKVVK